MLDGDDLIIRLQLSGSSDRGLMFAYPMIDRGYASSGVLSMYTGVPIMVCPTEYSLGVLLVGPERSDMWVSSSMDNASSFR